jgi:signal peptidase II
VIAALSILFWVLRRGAAQDRFLTIALACVTGGIFGNLYDRLGFWHHCDIPKQWRSAVRDWILLRYGEYTWPNFNIADSLLVCGAALLVWHAISQRGVQNPVPNASAAQQSN